jgi:FkbM family methyltransferase
VKVPARDPGFAEARCHGVEAQQRLIVKCLRYVTKRDVAVDVGAHIGIWSRELAKTFGRVHAFEPVRENFDCLTNNVPTNVACYNMAVSQFPGSVAMQLPAQGNSGQWHVAGVGDVPCVRLDDLPFDALDLLKLDVEGCEGYVVAGAVDTLIRHAPLVIFEDNGLGRAYYGNDWVDPKGLLEYLGYRRINRINKDEIWHR